MRVRNGVVALMLLSYAGIVGAQDALPQPGVQPEGAPPANAEQQYQQQLGYCLGLDFGTRLRADSVEADFAGIVAGIRDALTGAAPQLSEEQIAAVMNRFQQQLEQKAETRMADIAAENEAKGTAFLAKNRSAEGIQETPSGLQYRVIEAGAGEAPGPTDVVRCHYEGTLIDGSVFDSSYKRGQPAEFGVNQVISGWTEALQMMQPGAKWEVFLPSSIAYGPRGAGGAIGPNETLIFTIELLGIVE
ncbi:FKBP-type peptidyl-prolyl cis-trans isomerase [Botrimarina hoheduenensis]|uniref:Peptidyl-prolyl cis-trans isomerase n=1 Tax=Botrimarina hoheduenensis TaxID=2528000 RepID=A0A5C5WAT7_9BACT|nr:FKBP-type peptidyl-prolyl cis-trans isomerase [Botrimarina hoheduenensis]TWT47373.1 Outer membrane protein MIP precursor [Botrimarina hoheduenensis]